MISPFTIGALLAVAAAAGALLRYVIGELANVAVPFGTLAVNLAASFLLGLVAQAEDPIPVVVGIGALGALSTWSTAADETATLARDGEGRLAAAYLALTVTSGIVAAWLGLVIGRAVF